MGNPSSPYQTSIVYGMRGVGKTTFLTDINHRLAKKKDWIVADLAVGNNLMRMLIDQLYENSSSQVKKIFDNLPGLSFSAYGLPLFINC